MQMFQITPLCNTILYLFHIHIPIWQHASCIHLAMPTKHPPILINSLHNAIQLTLYINQCLQLWLIQLQLQLITYLIMQCSCQNYSYSYRKQVELCFELCYVQEKQFANVFAKRSKDAFHRSLKSYWSKSLMSKGTGQSKESDRMYCKHQTLTEPI